MRVLLIEDDKTVSQNIALILKKENKKLYKKIQ